MSTENPIAHACRLLRETAKELQQAHKRGDRDDWTGEPEAKAAFDEYMAVAGALGALASAAAPAEQPVAPTEKYDDTLLPFLALMRKELHANHDKGDRPGWLKMSADQALLEIYWHTAKLSAAVKNGDGPAIIEHSADVANMAMMLLDVCGGIPTPQAAPSVLEDWRLDHSAGRPILVYKDCSVIEAEQAQEVLDALRASRWQAPAQQGVQRLSEQESSTLVIPATQRGADAHVRPLEMNADLLEIFGRPNFSCAPIAAALRMGGQVIAKKAEHEQAAVILYLFNHYLKDSADWWTKAREELLAFMEAAEQQGGAA